MFFRRKNEEEIGNVDNPEADVIKRRTKTTIIVEISIRPDQIKNLESDLEELCNHYLDMRDEEAGTDDAVLKQGASVLAPASSSVV